MMEEVGRFDHAAATDIDAVVVGPIDGAPTTLGVSSSNDCGLDARRERSAVSLVLRWATLVGAAPKVGARCRLFRRRRGEAEALHSGRFPCAKTAAMYVLVQQHDPRPLFFRFPAIRSPITEHVSCHRQKPPRTVVY